MWVCTWLPGGVCAAFSEQQHVFCEQVWREKVFPLLQNHIAQHVDSISTHLLVYHEAALTNLLEVKLGDTHLVSCPAESGGHSLVGPINRLAKIVRVNCWCWLAVRMHCMHCRLCSFMRMPVRQWRAIWHWSSAIGATANWSSSIRMATNVLSHKVGIHGIKVDWPSQPVAQSRGR